MEKKTTMQFSLQPIRKVSAAKVCRGALGFRALRHEEIYQSDVLTRQKPSSDGFPIHRVDESPTDYSSPGWSPPEPDSASPVSLILKCGRILGKKK